MSEHHFDNTENWIYPALSPEDQTKKFFVCSDSSYFNATVPVKNIWPTSRDFINEKNVANVVLIQTDSKSHYDHVPLNPNILPDTTDRKYLLYCLGSSDQKTAESVNKMVAATFEMLNDAEAELTKRNFQVWIVANPAAYQPTREGNPDENYQYNCTESIMFDHLSKLNPSINVFDWYASIVENTDEDYRTIQFAKYGYYDYQKLILYRVMQAITGIPLLKTEDDINTFMPHIKESFFLKLSPEAVSLTPSATTLTTTKDCFKKFYGIMREAFEIECRENGWPLPYSVVLSGDIAKSEKFERDEFSQKVIQRRSYRKLNLGVAIKIMDARPYNGNVEKLMKKLTAIDNKYIAVIHIIDTDTENFNIFYLVTTLCSNDSLYEQICKGRPEKYTFLQWMRDTAAGLIYLEENKILHCNIKPSTVMLDSNNNPKICNFKNIEWMENPNASTVRQTSKYIAPELLKGKLCDSRVDVWSYSILVLEMIVGILKPEFCQDLRDGKRGSLDEILASFPQSLQNVLREGLIVETGLNTEVRNVQHDGKKKRPFMSAMLKTLIDVTKDILQMTEESWQTCSNKNFV